MQANETKGGMPLVISRESIERWFSVLEYLLFKITFFTLAAIGAYHLIAHS